MSRRLSLRERVLLFVMSIVERKLDAISEAAWAKAHAEQVAFYAQHPRVDSVGLMVGGEPVWEVQGCVTMAENALKVISLDDEISAWLAEHDPKALEQVDAALDALNGVRS